MFTWHSSYLITLSSGYFYLFLFCFWSCFLLGTFCCTLMFVSSNLTFESCNCCVYYSFTLYNHWYGWLEMYQLNRFFGCIPSVLYFFFFTNLLLDWILFMITFYPTWVIIHSLSKISIVYNNQLNSSSNVASSVNIKKYTSEQEILPVLKKDFT